MDLQSLILDSWRATTRIAAWGLGAPDPLPDPKPSYHETNDPTFDYAPYCEDEARRILNNLEGK
jgi:hypothetical protein